ncbi:MAG: DUF4278 domain-containing protein [Thermosynechococcaceae cyanobacterium]
MLPLIDHPQVQSATEQPAAVEPTHKLIYRGLTYDVPQNPVPARSPAEMLQLLGKRLSYRGLTFEIVPAFMMANPVPKPVQQLRYRGLTFTSSNSVTSSDIEYSVV